MCLLSQLLSKVGLNCHILQVLHVQCVCLAAGRRTQAGDATDQCFQLLLLRRTFHDVL